MKKLLALCVALALVALGSASAWAWSILDGADNLNSPTITGPVVLNETLGDEVSALTCAGWGLTTPVGATSCTDSPLTITRTASGSNLTLTYSGTQTITPGTTYEIVATYTLTAGSMSSTIGGRVGATYSSTVTMHEYFPAATNGKHIITFVAATAGTITGISVRPVTNTIHASEGPVVMTAALGSAGNQSGMVDIVTGTKSGGTMSVRDFIDAGSGGTRYGWRVFNGATETASVTAAGLATFAGGLAVTNPVGVTFTSTHPTAGFVKFYQGTDWTSTANAFFSVQPSSSAVEFTGTGQQQNVLFKAEYAQSGAGGSTDLTMVRAETSLGSGTHKFISLLAGVAGDEEKFAISNSGIVLAGGGSANKAMCWKADGTTLGYCSAVVDATGACGTCN